MSKRGNDPGAAKRRVFAAPGSFALELSAPAWQGAKGHSGETGKLGETRKLAETGQLPEANKLAATRTHLPQKQAHTHAPATKK